jgi:integrase
MAVEILSPTRARVYGRKGYWPDDPNRTREYFRGPTAHEQARERDEELRGLSRYKSNKTRQGSIFFEDAAKKYLANGANRMRPSTLSDLNYKITKNLMPALGNIAIDQITPDIADAYVARRLKTVKAVTVHSELTYLIAILNWCVSKQFIASHRLFKYKKPRRDDARIMPPTPDEIDAILKHAKYHLKRALLISVYCGIRPGAVELLSLRYDDVDWTGETLFVRSAEKGGPRDRTIPLHPFIYECLNCWYEDDMAAKNVDRPELIVHWRGRAVKKLRRSWSHAKEKAGITRRLRMYDCRHAFATALADQGQDLRTISELLGHSRPDTTARIYRHTSKIGKRNAINALNWIGGTDGDTR